MKKIHCLYDRLLPLNQFKPHPKNRNKHSDEQVERLSKILDYQGVRYPIKISKRSGYITSGHGRLMAAKLLGWDSFPVNYQDYESEEQEYADVQSDNAIASWAELDLSTINIDIQALGPDFDIDLLGIKGFEIDVADRGEGNGDPDDVPETPKKARSQSGELWLLGNHRLLCGDSTKREDVEMLMAGERAQIAFTSPPYNAAKNSFLNGRVSGFDTKYQNSADELSDDDFISLLSGFTALAIEYSDYVFVNLQLLAHNRMPLVGYLHSYRDVLKDVLVWNKKQCPPNIVKGAFNTKFEFIFCLSRDAKTRGFPVDWRGQHPNVVETESNSSNEYADFHRAGFPVALPNWFIEKLPFASVVYEPFCGTGTTVIACEKNNRRCFGMEIDPHYCDVILDRYAKYTGKDPIREDGVSWAKLKSNA